jgi:hypothetical protein
VGDSKLQVWILEKSPRGEMEWTLRHDSVLFQASLNCGRQEHGPWILHDANDDNKEPVVEHTFDEWNSDDDDNVLNVGDRSTNQDCCGYLQILGFHPYKEIVFFNRRLNRGLAYLKERRPEGGEWEPQISFETFDRRPKINPKGTQTKATKIRATES